MEGGEGVAPALLTAKKCGDLWRGFARSALAANANAARSQRCALLLGSTGLGKAAPTLAA